MPRKHRRTFKHRTVAIVYDFDGTLSPLPMQEYTVFPRIGVKGKKFWDSVKKESSKEGGEPMITYMVKMLNLANENSFPITKRVLGNLANRVKYFPGVEKYFKRIDRYVRARTKKRVKIKHYIISAGLKEILDKVSIHQHFRKIYASEYSYDHYNAAQFPKLVVTDTIKTQFLFRINKGKEELWENVNEHMPESDRPIPFSNILYIGDGLSDVPSMTVTTKNGGYAIGVYRNREGLRKCKNLFKNGRIDFIAKADFREGSNLDKAIKVVLDTIIQGIFYLETSFKQYIRLN